MRGRDAEEIAEAGASKAVGEASDGVWRSFRGPILDSDQGRVKSSAVVC